MPKYCIQVDYKFHATNGKFIEKLNFNEKINEQMAQTNIKEILISTDIDLISFSFLMAWLDKIFNYIFDWRYI